MIALYEAINQEPFGIPTVRIHRKAPSQRGDSKRFFFGESMNCIEQLFFDELLGVLKKRERIEGTEGRADVFFTEEESRSDCISGQANVFTEYGYVEFLIDVKPQYAIGRYIADFVISFTNHYVEESYVAIEIDGHQWHEKTKTQAMHDKQRERYLLRKDYPVMRFTGSEIFHNTEECAKEVLSIMIDRSIIKLSQCVKVSEIAYPYIFNKETE